MLFGTQQPQMVGPSAFHEAQIIGVIHNAAKVCIFVIDADLHMVAAVANLAVDMGKGHVALDCLESDRFAQIGPPCKRGYDINEPGPPKVTSTISGGTPSRNGMMLQPRPPETTTSQFMRIWP